LAGAALIANPRDADEPAVDLRVQAGVPAVETASRVGVPAGRTVAVPFSLLLPEGATGRHRLPLLLRAFARGHAAALDASCHVWLVRGVAWAEAPGRPPAEISPLSGPEVALGETSGDWIGLEEGAWAGPQDLSARFRLAWTPQNLILSAVVRDDVHVQGQQPEDMWRSDSLQLAFDYRGGAWRALAAGRPARWLEIGLALHGDGRAMGFRWFPKRGPLDGVSFSLSRHGEETQYLVSVPAHALGAGTLLRGDVIGFAALVNDDDGHGREGWLALDDGIGFSKDPRKYGLLALD